MYVELSSLEDIDSFVSRWKLPDVVTPEPEVYFVYRLKNPDGTFIICQGEIMQSLTVGKQIDFTMGVPKDQYGNDTAIDGAYTFVNKNPADATFTLNAAGDGGTVLAGTVANVVVEIEISADVDRGAGLKTHTESLFIVLQSGEALAFAANFGPESDPVVVPPVEPPVDPVVPPEA